jgi:hypothetical protein
MKRPIGLVAIWSSDSGVRRRILNVPRQTAEPTWLPALSQVFSSQSAYQVSFETWTMAATSTVTRAS